MRPSEVTCAHAVRFARARGARNARMVRTSRISWRSERTPTALIENDPRPEGRQLFRGPRDSPWAKAGSWSQAETERARAWFAMSESFV